jgi:hypothetical protein
MRYRVLLIMLSFFGATAVHDGAHAAGNDKYRVGDRLQKFKAPAEAKKNYQEVGWDALIPEGWDPVKAFKGIDFSRLNDGDPRAMDALDKLKQA